MESYVGAAPRSRPHAERLVEAAMAGVAVSADDAVSGDTRRARGWASACRVLLHRRRRRPRAESQQMPTPPKKRSFFFRSSTVVLSRVAPGPSALPLHARRGTATRYGRARTYKSV